MALAGQPSEMCPSLWHNAGQPCCCCPSQGLHFRSQVKTLVCIPCCWLTQAYHLRHNAKNAAEKEGGLHLKVVDCSQDKVALALAWTDGVHKVAHHLQRLEGHLQGTAQTLLSASSDKLDRQSTVVAASAYYVTQTCTTQACTASHWRPALLMCISSSALWPQQSSGGT